MGGAKVLRLVTGAAGLAATGFGASLLFGGPDLYGTNWLGPGVRDPWEVVLWLAGSALVHDVLIAPVVLLLGMLVLPLVAARLRGPLRGAFLTAGCLFLVAVPPLFAPRPARNPSVLPLNYAHGLLLSLAAVAVGALLVACVPWRRLGRPRARGSATE